MITYWLMFGVTAIASLAEANRPSSERRSSVAAVMLSYLLLVILIGFRWEVGGDWINYVRNLDQSRGVPLSELLRSGDPGYELMGWIALRFGWGIVGANTLCAILFSWGLIAFCRAQPNPWLALLVSVPYLVIVVAMGYSRQGVAIGLAMLGLASLSNGSTFKFVLWVVAAATFHKTVVILIPIAALASTRHRWWSIVWVTIAGIVAYNQFLADSYETFVTNYILTEYNSQGATIRVTMNAIPAIVFLLMRKNFSLTKSQYQLWSIMSYIALAFVPALLLSPSSTAVDRMALYFIPLQIFVFSRIPTMSHLKEGARQQLRLGVIAYYGAVQFTWLVFAVHSWAWLPYKTALF